MPKKFINPNWKNLRKLDARLRQAYFYCWDKADAIGVYEVDSDYMKLEIGSSFNATELSALPNAVKISADKILFTDYILVNYVVLKEDYNPHKPAFRALTYHKLNLHPTFTQVCLKVTTNLEDEEEDKEEDKEEKGKGGVGEKGLMVSKLKAECVPSSLESCLAYFTQLGHPEEASKFFDFFSSNGWKVSGRAPMKDWQASARGWCRRVNPTQSSNRRIVGKTTEQDIRNNLEHFKQLWAQTKNNENQ